MMALRRPGAYTLLHVGGWLLFGAAVTIGWTEIYAWHVNLVTTPPYVLIGFALSLVLGLLYDRLGVGPASFARALAITLVAAAIAGAVWSVVFTAYQCYVANGIHSWLIGEPSRLGCRRPWYFDGALDNALPLFGWGLVRLGLLYNTALREQREQALRAVADARDARLRMLAYQLNPHFLFNTLNSIRALISEDRARAREMVTALSGYLRYALVERPLHVALLEEEVAAVRGYLAIEQVRFEERLDARMDIEPAALQCEVPAFLLNPLVENAVKHGARSANGAPLVIRVEARMADAGRLRIAVENTGHWDGAPASGTEDGDEPGGVGLANVRARLEAIHPGEHRLEIEQVDRRVRVTVELPARCRGAVAT